MDKVLSNKKIILLFVLPALLLYCLIIPFPVISSIYYGFTKWNVIGRMNFIGLQNYIRLFTEDPLFLNNVKNTFVFLFASLLLQQPAAFFFSIMLTKGIRAEKFFRNIYFMPVVFSGVSVSLMWYFIYHPEVGIINNIIRIFGNKGFNFAWLGEGKTALLAVCIALAWQYIGYHMTIYVSGISSIGTEIFEAARIDGANEWQLIRNVIFPMLMPVIQVSMVLITTSSLKAFDYIFIMTYGGPDHASEVIAFHMYNKAFVQLDYGYGSSISTVLLVLCILASGVISKIFRDRNDEIINKGRA